MNGLKDVAKLAGVSIATVSRVVNRSAAVSDQKRQAVEAAIEKLNYRPNLTASTLRARDSKIIGLIVPGRTHATFGMNTSYIADFCQRNNYSLLIGLNHDNPETEADLLDSFYRRNIDGIILSTGSEENFVLKLIEGHDVPTVIIDRVFTSNKFTSISVDNFRAGYIAGQYLAELGHKKIGCITMPVTRWQCYQRLLGFKKALQDNKIDILDKYIVEVADFQFHSGVTGAEILLNYRYAKDFPTALWALEDTVAAGVMQAFINAGYRIPDDISIMGMDNLDISYMLSPGLTTITYPFKEISQMAVDCIIQYGNMKDPDRKQYILDPELVIRQSTGTPSR